MMRNLPDHLQRLLVLREFVEVSYRELVKLCSDAFNRDADASLAAEYSNMF